MSSENITKIVTDLLDDAAAVAAPKVARRLSDELYALAKAAQCRSAAIGFRLDGSINMALDEERMSDHWLGVAKNSRGR